MRTLLAAIALASLAASGVETVTTAATVAEAKRREMEQAKKSIDMAKQKIEALAGRRASPARRGPRSPRALPPIAPSATLRSDAMGFRV